MADGDVIFERFDKARHERKDFQAKYPEYTDYLQKVATQHGKRGVNVLYVAVREGDPVPMRVFGYFTASMGSIKNDDVDEEIRVELDLLRLQIPTLHIGMMAVDQSVAGRGIGKLLVAEAVKLALDFRSHIGCWGLSIDMDKDHVDELLLWYRKRNFALLKREGLMMALPLGTVAKAVAK
jgi:GNAT superfamily N-acetyltransferase